MVKLVVFDLDGTLVDSRVDLAESANELLERYGARPLSVERVTSMVGEGARVLVERVMAAASVAADETTALGEFLAIYERRLAIHTRLYPGVLEALDALGARVRLAMLTNKPVHHTALLTKALGISGYFVETIGGDSGFGRKPDPDGLLHLMRVHGAVPADTMMVGDSAVDVDTARRAGCRVCVARFGFGHVGAVEVLPPGSTEVGDSRLLGAVLLRALGA